MEAVLQRKLLYLLNNLSLQDDDLQKLFDKGIITRTVQRELAAEDDPLETIRALYQLIKQNEMDEETFVKITEEVNYEVAAELKTEMKYEMGDLEVEKSVKDESGFVVRRQSLLNRRISENQKRAFQDLVAKRTQCTLNANQRVHDHLQKSIEEQKRIETFLDQSSQRLQDKINKFIKGQSSATFCMESLQLPHTFQVDRNFQVSKSREPLEDLHDSVRNMLIFNDLKNGELSEMLREKRGFMQELKNYGVKSQAMDKAVEEALATLIKEKLYQKYKDERLVAEMDDLLASKYLNLWRKKIRQRKTRRETKEIRRQVQETEMKIKEQEAEIMQKKQRINQGKSELKDHFERGKELRKSKAMALMHERDMSLTMKKKDNVEKQRRARSFSTPRYKSSSLVGISGPEIGRYYDNREPISYHKYNRPVYVRRARSRTEEITLDPPRVAFQLTDDEDRPHTSFSGSTDLSDYRSEVSLSRRDSGHGSATNSPDDGQPSPLLKLNPSGANGQLSSSSLVNYDFNYMYGKPVRRRGPVSPRPKTSRIPRSNAAQTEAVTSSRSRGRPVSVAPGNQRRRGDLLQTL